uniref:CUB domain containing protein 1 n=1 Tax=Myripristis murdjan TaxID=586833 RepID=A0A667XCQ0_9TELE
RQSCIESGTTVVITRNPEEPECNVCSADGPDPTCHATELTLTKSQNTSLEFSCPKPQDVFSVYIKKKIDCTETSCAGDIVQAESSLFPDFNRTFSWDLKVPATRAFRLDFPEPGMRQIPKGENCPDEHTYTIVTYLRSGPAIIGKYCKGGTVTTIQVRYKGRMLLNVPGDRKLEPLDFKLSVGPETDSKCCSVILERLSRKMSVSETDFVTANYPDSFPDDQQMMWNFIVPGMHNYTVRFRDHTAPECLNKEVMVKYEKEDKKVTQLTLTDPQPEHGQGNVNMSLFNCETNKTLQGLTLAFTVSVMRSGHPVLCTVDLTKKQGVSLQLEKVGADPYCEMSIDSVVKQKINVAMGTKASLSFLDCPNEDVRLTASKDIGKTFCIIGTLLTVPKLDSCLPMPLHSFTWLLSIPEHGTVDLESPTGSLRQSLPGQECNGSVSLHVAESDGFSIGDFCSKGIIRKVQVHANVSVTATGIDFAKKRGPFLNVSFSEEISDRIIYRVTPKMSDPALLATPNWPQGMKPSTTVSWIVTLSNRYRAAVQFLNVSQPKCGKSHTGIKVQTLGSKEEMFSRREDEKKEGELTVPESFYLNMSNCLPEEGHFGAVTKVVLEKKTNLLAIALGIAGALLFVLAVLAVVCYVTKKKKKGQMKTESSIYITKGNIFRPGDRHFSKARSDNDSHVYASIDETMVYGHLLPDSSYADSMEDRFNGMQVDSYQTFTGPSDRGLPVIVEPDADPDKDQYKAFLEPSETFIPSRPRTPIDRQDSLGFQDRRMVDNELYTFKSTGEINTIRLSGVDLEPEPPVDE